MKFFTMHMGFLCLHSPYGSCMSVLASYMREPSQLTTAVHPVKFIVRTECMIFHKFGHN